MRISSTFGTAQRATEIDQPERMFAILASFLERSVWNLSHSTFIGPYLR